jgi:hypothetical protein
MVPASNVPFKVIVSVEEPLVESVLLPDPPLLHPESVSNKADKIPQYLKFIFSPVRSSKY